MSDHKAEKAATKFRGTEAEPFTRERFNKLNKKV